MKRIIVIASIVVGFFSALGGAAGASTLRPDTPVDDVGRRDAWACIAVEHVGFGVCQGNPVSN